MVDKYELVYMPLVTSVLPDFKPAATASPVETTAYFQT